MATAHRHELARRAAALHALVFVLIAILIGAIAVLAYLV